MKEVEPDKRVSMAGAGFIFGLYMPYYYWIKKRHCPACLHGLSGDELAGYKDPDKTWKYLSAAPVVVFILGILLALAA